MKFLTKSGGIIHQVEPDMGQDTYTRPEIDRTALHRILFDSFGAEHVKWDHEVVSVKLAQDGQYDLHFMYDKVETGFDLVVGADGAHSRIRPRITPVTPFYFGLSIIELDISDPKGHRYDTANELVDKGSTFAFSGQTCIQAQRLGNDTLRIYAGFGMDEVCPNWLKEHFDASDPATTKAKVSAHFKDWKPVMQDSLRLADEDHVEFRALYMHPVDEIWEPHLGLALIGDAAHLMTPYAGEGVNIAMRNSLELGRKIIEGVKSGDLNRAVREYEINVFKRGPDSKGADK